MTTAPPSEFTLHAQILLTFVGFIWVVWLADEISRGTLKKNGVRPHSDQGLSGILFAPLLHDDFRHIAANSVSLLALGWILLIRDVEDFFIITAVVWVISGLGTWIFGNAKSNHIGASGIIFGYLGFLISLGYFERSVGTIALSVLMLVIYGRMLWFVFPIRDKMSWEMHLFGFAGGVLVARHLPELRQWVEGSLF